jgi:hypothetical protein
MVGEAALKQHTDLMVTGKVGGHDQCGPCADGPAESLSPIQKDVLPEMARCVDSGATTRYGLTRSA